MPDYSINELEKWDDRIEKIAREEGLDCYGQEFEIVSYEDMISYEAYIGMPSHYPHWSYGKAYERKKTMNKYNISGLPYEMVINSNPCIAYLMKDNTLLLQILTIAHVYGHNDFFKNNRLFKQGTQAEYTIEMFKSHADRIREYIADPGIGYSKVEKILNAAHALRFQTSRVIGEKRLSDEDMKKQKIPQEPEDDLLFFISRYGRLMEWEKDIINIVREETFYFIPQIETRIMNEGWASFWHYTILNRLSLPQNLHIEFIKRHNQIIRPNEDNINPYYIGFKIFEALKKNNKEGQGKLFEGRELERDESFIRRYLTYELCCEMNLFEYVKSDNEYLVSEVSDEDGWRNIRNTIAASVGLGGFPVIRIKEWVQKDNSLILEHNYDGREMELNYTYETMKHLEELWEGKILLITYIDGKKKIIICDDQKKIGCAT